MIQAKETRVMQRGQRLGLKNKSIPLAERMVHGMENPPRLPKKTGRGLICHRLERKLYGKAGSHISSFRPELYRP